MLREEERSFRYERSEARAFAAAVSPSENIPPPFDCNERADELERLLLARELRRLTGRPINVDTPVDR